MPETRLKREISESQPEIVRTKQDQLTAALLLSVVEEVRSAMSASAAIVVVRDGEGMRCIASAVDEEIAGSRVEPDSVFTRECLETGKVVLCEDAENDSRIEPPVLQNLHLRGAVAVPIQVQDSVVGVVEVFSSRPVQSADITPLQGVANFLAPILTSESMRSGEPAVGQVADAAPAQERSSEEQAGQPATALNLTGSPADRSPAVSGTAAAVESGEEASRVAEIREAVWRSDPESAPSWATDKGRSGRARFVGGVLLVISLVALVWAFPRFASNPTTASHGGVQTGPRGDAYKQAPLGPVEPQGPAPVGELPGFQEPDRASQGGVSPSSASPTSPNEKAEGAVVADSEGSRTVPGEQGATKGSGFSRQRDEPKAAEQRDLKPPEIVHNDEVVAPPPTAPRLSEEAKRESFEPLKSTEALIALPAGPPPIKAKPDFVLDRTVKGHSSWVTGVAFSSDDGRLASGSWDETVKLWDVPTGRQLGALNGKMKEVQALAFSRDGRWLAAENSSDTVTLWEAATGREIRTLPSDKSVGAPGTNWVYSIAFSPDGRWLASGVDNKTVRIWEVSTGRAARDLTAQRRAVVCVAFSPDGRLLATGDDEKRIGIWDVATGREIQKLSGHKKAINAVAFSPNGRWLASASADKTVKLWDISDGSNVYTLLGHKNIVTSLSFSPDSRWLASGSWDKTIKIWDVETGHEVQSLGAQSHPIYSVAFDSCGRWLASGSEDGTINLWRLSGATACSRSR